MDVPKAAEKAGDRVVLDSILDMMAQDRPEGLNWPGVAQLIRRALGASRPSPAPKETT